MRYDVRKFTKKLVYKSFSYISELKNLYISFRALCLMDRVLNYW